MGLSEPTLEMFARQAYAVNWVAGACMTTLLYSHLLTFSQEVARIWPSRLSLAKILFLLNRYLVEALILFNCISASQPFRSPGFCVFYLRWLTVYVHPGSKVSQCGRSHQACLSLSLSLSVDVYTGAWTWGSVGRRRSRLRRFKASSSCGYGLYVSTRCPRHTLSSELLGAYHPSPCPAYVCFGFADRHSKVVLAITYFFFFGGTVTLVGLVIKDYVGEDVLIDHTLAALPGCYATSVPSIIAGFWIGPLIVETVLFAIVISRAFVWWRDGTPTPRILTMLTTDSTVYFAVIFAMLLANYLMFRYGPPFLSSLLVTPSTTAGCVIASQMFLRMRSMMEYDPEEVVMKAYNAWNVQNSSSSPHSYINTTHIHTRSNPHSAHPHTQSNSHFYPHTRHRREGLSAELSSGGFEVVIPLPTRGASSSSRGNSASEGRWAEGVIGSVGDKSVGREGY